MSVAFTRSSNTARAASFTRSTISTAWRRAACARWTRGLDEADAALVAGRYEQALAGYDQAEARFERTPAAKQLFQREYARASRNRLWALYQLKRYDDAIAVAERAPAEANPFF